MVALYLDELFFKGKTSGDGSRLLAALKHFTPAISRFATVALPRSHRAVKSWTRAAPGLQRLPLRW